MTDESLFGTALGRRRPETAWQRLTMAWSPRPVWVCLPAGDTSKSGFAYPVIYLEGGDEWFCEDPCGMAIDAWTDELTRRGLLAESILVAVGCDPQAGAADYSPEQAGAERTDFLVHHLIPTIESTLPAIRHRSARVLAGMALGALHALDTVRRYPAIFCGVAGWSTSFEDLSQSPPASCGFLRAWGDSAHPSSRVRIALTYGCHGLDECYEGYHREFEALLIRGGWQAGHDYRVTRHQHAGHGPGHWRFQIGTPLAFVAAR